jgi:mannose-6-phosphate isomerase-like protein (cupin superfamily)
MIARKAGVRGPYFLETLALQGAFLLQPRWNRIYPHRMEKRIVLPGEGKSYDWAKDHIFIKSTFDLSDGRVTLAEDLLKPGFFLARHHHKKMIEIFYVLEGSVDFVFDDEKVTATVGTTLNVPPNVWHEVRSEDGAKLLTIFSPGGFDQYLEELVALPEGMYADAPFMKNLAERFDIFER